jgi:hypothetical protein
MLENILDKEKVDYINELIYYSDLKAEEVMDVWKVINVKLSRCFERNFNITYDDIYKTVSGILIQRSLKSDPTSFAFSLDAPIKQGEKSNFYTLHIGEDGRESVEKEESEEIQEIYQKSETLKQALSFLENHLSRKEYNYLSKLIRQNPDFLIDNLRLDGEFIKFNTCLIREKINLAMRLYPTLNSVHRKRIHALNLEGAISPYVIEIYKEVLMGTVKRFPYGFFCSEREVKAKILINYLLRDFLKFDLKDIPKKISKSLFEKNKLRDVLQFSYGLFEAINKTYPSYFKPWEFNKVPGHYWKKEREHVIEATRWLIEEKAKIPIEEIPKKVNTRLFEENRFVWMLDFYKGSFHKAIEVAYPGKFKVWEFNKVPQTYWQGEEGFKNSLTATEWLVEKEIKNRGCSFEEIYENSHDELKKLFSDYNLSGMLRCNPVFRSPKKAVKITYSLKFLDKIFNYFS